MARKPADREIGRHILKGLRYDINGNPLYTCDTFSNEIAKAIGWRFSPKYGLYGQFPVVSDPTIFNESKNTIRLTESELKKVITESVKNILRESEGELPWYGRDVQNNLVEISRIVSYLVNDYLYFIPQEQLNNLGDMTLKYLQFLSMFMKQIDSKRW